MHRPGSEPSSAELHLEASGPYWWHHSWALIRHWQETLLGEKRRYDNYGRIKKTFIVNTGMRQCDSMKRARSVVLYLQQEPDSCPQSWNKQGTQPRQPASARLLSDDARSRADRALAMAASRTTVPRSDRAAGDGRNTVARKILKNPFRCKKSYRSRDMLRHRQVHNSEPDQAAIHFRLHYTVYIYCILCIYVCQSVTRNYNNLKN